MNFFKLIKTLNQLAESTLTPSELIFEIYDQAYADTNDDSKAFNAVHSYLKNGHAFDLYESKIQKKLQFTVISSNNEDRTITVLINNIRYEYFINLNGNFNDIYRKIKFMTTKSPGKTLQYIKDHSSKVIKEGIESAPPDLRLQAWIESSRPLFTQRYGDRAEAIMNACAWTEYNKRRFLKLDESNNSLKSKLQSRISNNSQDDLSEGWMKSKSNPNSFSAELSDLSHHQGAIHCPKCKKVIKHNDLFKNPNRDADNDITDWESKHDCGAKLVLFNDSFIINAINDIINEEKKTHKFNNDQRIEWVKKAQSKGLKVKGSVSAATAVTNDDNEKIKGEWHIDHGGYVCEEANQSAKPTVNIKNLNKNAIKNKVNDGKDVLSAGKTKIILNPSISDIKTQQDAEEAQHRTTLADKLKKKIGIAKLSKKSKPIKEDHASHHAEKKPSLATMILGKDYNKQDKYKTKVSKPVKASVKMKLESNSTTDELLKATKKLGVKKVSKRPEKHDLETGSPKQKRELARLRKARAQTNESSEQRLRLDELTGKGSLETIKKNAEDAQKKHPVSKQYLRSYKVSKKPGANDKANAPIRRGAISTIQRVNGLISVRNKDQYADNAKNYLKDKIRRNMDRVERKKMRGEAVTEAMSDEERKRYHELLGVGEHIWRVNYDQGRWKNKNVTLQTKNKDEAEVHKHRFMKGKKINKIEYQGVRDAPEESVQTNEHIEKIGSKYRLVSKKTGKNLGTYDSKAGAEKREKQVEYFKSVNEAADHVCSNARGGRRCDICFAPLSINESESVGHLVFDNDKDMKKATQASEHSGLGWIADVKGRKIHYTDGASWDSAKIMNKHFKWNGKEPGE